MLHNQLELIKEPNGRESHLEDLVERRGLEFNHASVLRFQ